MMTDATINVPSLMPISVEPADQHSIQHGSAATMLPAVVHGPASPTPKRRKMVLAKGWKATKVDKGGARSSRPLSDPSVDFKDAVKALEAKTEILAFNMPRELIDDINNLNKDKVVTQVRQLGIILTSEVHRLEQAN